MNKLKQIPPSIAVLLLAFIVIGVIAWLAGV